MANGRAPSFSVRAAAQRAYRRPEGGGGGRAPRTEARVSQCNTITRGARTGRPSTVDRGFVVVGEGSVVAVAGDRAAVGAACGGGRGGHGSLRAARLNKTII